MPQAPPPPITFNLRRPGPDRRPLLALGVLIVVLAAVLVVVLVAKPFASGQRLSATAKARRATVAGMFAGTSLPASVAAARQLPDARAAAARVTAHGTAAHPNIVFVLTDDLSLELLQYMPTVLQMEKDGVSFSNYFVADSLCCPSRSTIFTGDYPHDTHVFSNTGRDGGYNEFVNRGDENHTFATALQHDGYATAMMGKYLNGYLTSASVTPSTYIPPGWTEWDVGGDDYSEYNYTLNEDGSLVSYGSDPSDYLTYQIGMRGLDFINQSVAAGKPFFLELATFSPHRPYTPAAEDLNDFPGLTAPRPPSFDRLPTNPPRWLAGHPPLSAAEIAQLDQIERMRAQAMQSVDRLIQAIQNQLTADGVAGDTYIVFSSDNGLHLGEYRLTAGKLTAFDTDIHVPLVVTGPGVPAGRTTSDVAENVDLAPTFTAIGSTTLKSDGHSLLALLQGKNPPDWRDAALIEHHGSDLSGADPDYQQGSGGNPRTYEAMRTPSFLYVEYNDGEREFYDLKTDPFELDNIADQLTPYEGALLHLDLERFQQCHGSTACWAASHVSLQLQPFGRAAAAGHAAAAGRATTAGRTAGAGHRAAAGAAGASHRRRHR